MELTESVRFVLTELDKSLLSAIAKQDGDASMSSTIRRLIRREARQRGLDVMVLSVDPIETLSSNE